MPTGNDDIVTRLRDTAEHRADIWLEAIVTEAADEIERLRAEVARLGSFLYPVGMVMTVHEGKNFDAEKIAELVVKAIRGE